jgi:hypothetical protein
VKLYVDAYIESGDPILAWQSVRQSEAYERHFAGNRREDGTLRMTEQEYVSNITAYEDAFISIGLNPRLFEEKFVTLIRGDVSPDELYQDRLEPIYERVIASSEFIMAEYAEQQGIDLSIEAIVAGIIDPDLGERILNRQITMAEIGGEAAERGFDIATGMADELFRQGIDRSGSERLFGEAASVLPVLSVLAQRHADLDDTFDLTEFVRAEIYDDPQQRRRMRRLISQERSLFGNVTGGLKVKTGRTGGRSGLQVL